MRFLMLGSAAMLLSGCSFLGLGGQKDYTNYNSQTGYYGQQQAVQPKSASTCHSGNCLARWNIEGGVGTSFAAGRNIITASRTNNLDGTDFNSISFADAYETGVRAELGGSYALAPNTKVTFLGHYEQADSEGTQDWGTIGGEQLTGSLSDYEAGVENTQLGGAVFSAAEVPLYRDSWVGTAAGLVGVETPLTRYSTIGLETGLRYQGGLKSDTSVLAEGTTLGGLNNNRGRLSVPLTLRGRYRF